MKSWPLVTRLKPGENEMKIKYALLVLAIFLKIKIFMTSPAGGLYKRLEIRAMPPTKTPFLYSGTLPGKI